MWNIVWKWIGVSIYHGSTNSRRWSKFARCEISVVIKHTTQNDARRWNFFLLEPAERALAERRRRLNKNVHSTNFPARFARRRKITLLVLSFLDEHHFCQLEPAKPSATQKSTVVQKIHFFPKIHIITWYPVSCFRSRLWGDDGATDLGTENWQCSRAKH